MSTSPRAALIYRLSGDWNPLHADPAAAGSAGFDRPILQGLASYGMAAHAVSRAAGRASSRVACRFCGIVMPGDVLDIRVWQIDSDRYAFEAEAQGRKVLDRGIVEVAG